MSIKLALLNIPAQRRYIVKAASRLILLNQVNESHEEATVTCFFASKDQEQLYFRLALEKIDQLTNTEEYNWEAQLSAAFETVELQTDLTGNILQITNKEQILDRWRQQRKIWQAKHRSSALPAEQLLQAETMLSVENGLETYLQHSSLYAILFPGLYGHYELHQSWQQEKSIPRFLSEYSLPFVTQCSLTPTTEYDILRQLNVVGVLDETKLAQKPFAKWLKNAVDTYDLRVKVTAELQEEYDFERDGWLTHAEQFVVAEAAGCYSHTVARTLEELK